VTLIDRDRRDVSGRLRFAHRRTGRSIPAPSRTGWRRRRRRRPGFERAWTVLSHGWLSPTSIGEGVGGDADFSWRFEILTVFLSPLRGLVPLSLFTHGLRRGLYSFAASRLLFGCCPHLPISLALPRKTSGVITPTAGARSRAIRVCCLAPWLSDVPGCPSLTWGGCGGREFPRTVRVVASGPYIRQIAGTEILSKGCSSQLENKFCGKL
jgi:hypothetical protein